MHELIDVIVKVVALDKEMMLEFKGTLEEYIQILLGFEYLSQEFRDKLDSGEISAKELLEELQILNKISSSEDSKSKRDVLSHDDFIKWVQLSRMTYD